MANRAGLVGVISDTHGLLRPQAVKALAGSELIIHAGDVGNPDIIPSLEALCPVIAVRGNIDKGDWANALPRCAVAEVLSKAIYVIHDVSELDLDPAEAGISVVVSGHSHRPASTVRGGVLYLNPGSAGPRRFQLPVTVARLELDHSRPQVDFIDLLQP
jgi:hypothetical protein